LGGGEFGVKECAVIIGVEPSIVEQAQEKGKEQDCTDDS